MRWAIFAVMLLALVGCAPKLGYKNVSVQDLKAASETNFVILDVRRSDEYASGHVPGARLLPVDEVASRVSELSKDTTYYVICHSGNRSKVASDALIKAGFKDIRNVEGGIQAWEAAGYPVER